MKKQRGFLKRLGSEPLNKSLAENNMNTIWLKEKRMFYYLIMFYYNVSFKFTLSNSSREREPQNKLEMHIVISNSNTDIDFISTVLFRTLDKISLYYAKACNEIAESISIPQRLQATQL